MAIVRELHGDISAQPVPDGGSVFTVSIPICTRAPILAEPVSAPDTRAETTASLDGKRVLVVDDEEGIRDFVGHSLTASGVSVDCADSSGKALEFAGKNSYDVVLCDLHLKSDLGLAVSGLELYEHICEKSVANSGARPPFIFMTGDLVDSGLRELAGRNGSRFLQKPFRLAELLSMLTETAGTAALQPKNSSS